MKSIFESIFNVTSSPEGAQTAIQADIRDRIAKLVANDDLYMGSRNKEFAGTVGRTILRDGTLYIKKPQSCNTVYVNLTNVSDMLPTVEGIYVTYNLTRKGPLDMKDDTTNQYSQLDIDINKDYSGGIKSIIGGYLSSIRITNKSKKNFSLSGMDISIDDKTPRTVIAGSYATFNNCSLHADTIGLKVFYKNGIPKAFNNTKIDCNNVAIFIACDTESDYENCKNDLFDNIDNDYSQCVTVNNEFISPKMKLKDDIIKRLGLNGLPSNANVCVFMWAPFRYKIAPLYAATSDKVLDRMGVNSTDEAILRNMSYKIPGISAPFFTVIHDMSSPRYVDNETIFLNITGGKYIAF